MGGKPRQAAPDGPLDAGELAELAARANNPLTCCGFCPDVIRRLIATVAARDRRIAELEDAVDRARSAAEGHEDEIADLEYELADAQAAADRANARGAARGQIETNGIRLRLGNCELEVWRDNRLVAQVLTSPSDHGPGPVRELVAAIVDVLS